MNNLVGEAAYTEYTAAVPGIEPTRPGLFTFTGSTRTTLDVAWSVLSGEDTGGTTATPITITGYHVYRDDGHSGVFSMIATVVSPTTYTVENMSPGLFYRFKLTAENEMGLVSDASTE